MKKLTLWVISLVCIAGVSASRAAEGPPVAGADVRPLFDRTTLAGWEGDTNLWRVENGALTGGSLSQTVKANDFLATTRNYTNFIVRMKIKLTGTEGFINSGFQIRSQRVPKSSEMAGYQCDFGDPTWWGAIYDESRRNKVMSPSDMRALEPVIKRQDWNEYIIRADGARITTWINGVQGTDYIESDSNILDWGKLGIQVHGGGKALVQVKDITIEELPPTPPGKKFNGAPEPKKGAKNSPLDPQEERASFTLSPGFEIELIASESDGIGKFVTIDWDTRGRLWTMTALEYPVDANENPAAAQELYASKAKDKVLVFDRDPASPTGYSSKPRLFADGLAIPLGILPYKNGVYVQHGTEIVFLSDTDGDNRADKRDVILTGFGVQDSHLFPHQFTRAPGNWIWMAQGAFNYGRVKTTKGAEIKFDQTRMARFRYDGSDFDITSQGPCNIWGLAMTAEGETWIQEANDYGYPAMPFHEYANYPGCSDAQFKSYAPEFPGTAPDFKMGGTGLSGLAFSDKTAWPEAYANILYVANPITRQIQAIKIHRDGSRCRLQKLPDFIQSSDEMFRPVALRTGPDGCLYIVDWYNKIISHNEVPRNHPERDKTRGRIWRVKQREQKPFAVPDFTKLGGEELLSKLGGDSLTQHHLAWQAIVDRQLTGLTPALKAIASSHSQTAAKRIGALWALEGLGPRFGGSSIDMALLESWFEHANPNLRREAVRAMGAFPPSIAGASDRWAASFQALEKLADDVDPEVRAEVIKTTARLLGLLQLSSDSKTASLLPQRALPLLLGMAKPALAQPTSKSTHNGKTIKVGAAYEREFERYLIRFFLERHPETLSSFLDSAAAKALPIENRLLASLALEPGKSATRVAQLLPKLDRPPGEEEVLRLAQFPDEPGVSQALKSTLENVVTRAAALEALIKLRPRLDAEKLTPLLADAAGSLWSGGMAARELAVRLAASFKLRTLEPEFVALLNGSGNVLIASASPPTGSLGEKPAAPATLQLAALRALREMNSPQIELFAGLIQSSPVLRDEALLALAASRSDRAPSLLLELWPGLNSLQRKSAMGSLAGTKSGAVSIVLAVKSGALSPADLDSATLDKLHAVLGDNPELALLMREMAPLLRPALRLDGNDNAWAETDITLDGSFTVETWVKLDPGIDNNDGILGAPDTLDINFAAARFRVWVAGGLHDVIISKKTTVPEVWTHLAVTRTDAGKFRLYLNGELDTDQSKTDPRQYAHLRIAWTVPAKGTAGWLSEYRIWNRVRSPEEIRADFDRSFEGEPTPDGLIHYFPGSGSWGKLHGGAKVAKTSDFPPLLTAAEARAQSETFARFRAFAEQRGNTARGRASFTTLCLSCHSISGEGGQVGPVLSGAGASGPEALLRNILTPSAAMEAGYRIFRVELKDGDVLDGIFVSQDKEAIILRRPNTADTRIAQKDVKRADFIRRSMMPEGLLDVLKPEEVADLFAYLKTLK